MIFNITKRNRKYFTATKNGYKCKILIDSNSESLEIGEQTLAVDDISVRSKYGTDLIYKLSANVEEQKEVGICTLKTDFYNSVLVDECRKLGGVWDKIEKVWIFPGFVADKVEILDEKYNSTQIGIEILFECSDYADCEPYHIVGFEIARAWDRDSGAKQAAGVSFVEGGATSGGSRKNWTTKIKEGSILRMSIPEMCFDDIAEEGFNVKKI